VLQLARADAARTHMEKSSVDLVAAVNKAMEPYAPAFTKGGKSVSVTSPTPVVICMGDGKKINRILRNLAENAATYTPSGETVQVTIAALEDGLRVTFTNRAEEVVPEDLPYLFERFYRGEKSRSREHGGAGIGLSIVKELVKAHGGSVGAELTDHHLNIWFSLPKT
jgi:two-component system, OmpR family, sensor histidine kinase BaeS